MIDHLIEKLQAEMDAIDGGYSFEPEVDEDFTNAMQLIELTGFDRHYRELIKFFVEKISELYRDSDQFLSINCFHNHVEVRRRTKSNSGFMSYNIPYDAFISEKNLYNIMNEIDVLHTRNQKLRNDYLRRIKERSEYLKLKAARTNLVGALKQVTDKRVELQEEEEYSEYLRLRERYKDV